MTVGECEHCDHYVRGAECCYCGDERPPNQGPYSTTALVDRSGLSNRQIDYLVRRRAIEASVRPASGQGTNRRWSNLDLARVKAIGDVWHAMCRMGHGGISADFVSRIWVALEDDGDFEFEDGPLTVRLVLDDYLNEDGDA